MIGFYSEVVVPHIGSYTRIASWWWQVLFTLVMTWRLLTSRAVPGDPSSEVTLCVFSLPSHIKGWAFLSLSDALKKMIKGHFSFLFFLMFKILAFLENYGSSFSAVICRGDGADIFICYYKYCYLAFISLLESPFCFSFLIVLC